MNPDYIQLNAQAEIAAEDVQRQINDQIQYTPALKEVLGGNSHGQGLDYQLGRVAVDRAIEAVGRPACETIGNTVGAGIGGAAGMGVGLLFPPIELPAIIVGAGAGRAVGNYTCNLTVKALGRTAWGKAYQAKADAKLDQAKTELSSKYETIHTQALQKLMDGKDAPTQAYLQDQYYRSIKQQPFYGLLNDEKKNAVNQERLQARATLVGQNATFQAMADQHDAIDVVTGNYIRRVSDIIATPQTNSTPPSAKMLAENQTFLKEFKAENAQLNAQTHRLVNAVLHEQKIYNKEIKKLNAHNDEQAKKEIALAQYKGMEAGFNVIGQIGAATGNTTIATIGSVGASGVSIAMNVAMVSGAIPGMALSGWGLAIPYAGIALAGLSIAMTLFGKKKKKDDPMMKALQALAEQIDAFRKEMHARLDELSAEIKAQFKALENLLTSLHNIIKLTLDDGFESIHFKLDTIQQDLARLNGLVTKGLGANYLQNYILTLSSLEQYTDMADNNEKEIKQHLVALTTWLTSEEILQQTNAYWTVPEKMTAGNALSSELLTDHAKLLGKENSLSLGYLAALAGKIPGMVFNEVTLEAVPNIALFTQGVETYALARLHIGSASAHAMDPENKTLDKIKATAENGLRWMEQLRSQEKTLLNALAMQYETRYKDLCGTMKEAAVNRLETGTLDGFKFPSQVALASNIQLPTTLLPNDQPTYHALTFETVKTKIQAQKDLQIPQFLQSALRLGVGQLRAQYTPKFTPAKANCVFVGNRTNNNNVIGRTADYDISVEFILGSHKYVLYTLAATYHEPDSGVTSLTMKDKYGGPGRDNYLFEQAAAKKNALPVNDFFRDSWPHATLSVKITDKTAEALPQSLVSAVSQQIAEKCFVAAGTLYPERGVIIKAILEQKDVLLKGIPKDLSALKMLLTRYSKLMNTSLDAFLTRLWDESGFYHNAGLHHHLQAFINTLKSAIRIIPVNTSRPLDPVMKHLQYACQMMDYIRQHEKISLENARTQLVEALQVDEEIIFDPNRIDANQLTDANKLGEGSYGQVYRVMDSQTNQNVAVKVFFNGAKLNDAARGEIEMATHQSMAQTHSPFLVNILGATRFPTRGNALVLELVENGTLEEHLHEKTPRLSWEHCQRITQEMVAALKYLHEQELAIVHGDFKSANVLLTNDYHVKVSDYGMSVVAGNTQRASTRPRPTKTQGGTVVYRAPELIDDETKHATPASDIYAFGVVLWEILTRQVPFSKTTGKDIEILQYWFKLSKGMTVHDHFAMPEPDAQQPELVRNLFTLMAPIVRECRNVTPEERPTAAALTSRITA